MTIRIRQLPSTGEGTEAQQFEHDKVGAARQAFREAEKVLRLLKKAKAAPEHLAEETAKVDRLRAEYYAAEDQFLRRVFKRGVKEGRA
jgi:hypothetical protein